jgi:hypothetical protein
VEESPVDREVEYIAQPIAQVPPAYQKGSEKVWGLGYGHAVAM